MVIKIKSKEVELKYTFNSFKFMGDFDMGSLADVESKPFKIVPMLETLLIGALNNNPKKRYTLEDVNVFIDEYMEDNSVVDLLNELMELLQESSFFKSLQRESKTETPTL